MRLMDGAPSVYCFLLPLIFLDQLAIDFIYILLNTAPSDLETGVLSFTDNKCWGLILEVLIFKVR